MELDNMILLLMVIACMAGMAVTIRENRMLNGYVEFYRRQLRSALEGYDGALDMLRDASEWYSELTNEYRNLYAAYEVAYGILKEHDLLPEDEE